MKRFALLPALSALLLAAVLIGAVFAPQAPPGPTSRQAGDMIPDAITIAAFAAQSTAGQLDPTLATPAQSVHTAELVPSQYDSPGGLMTSAQASALGFPALAATKEMAAQSAQTAQLAPSHFDDSIEAPQVAAAMRAMAAIHVPSMEAIRLALASAKAAAEEKSQEARLQDPTLATPAQTADLAPSQPQLSREAAQVAAATQAQSAQTAQAVGGPVVLPTKATSQVASLAEAGSQMAILQANRPAQGSQNPQLTSSHYAALGALTSAQARALGLPALAGIEEMAEERYLMAILQDPALLALVQAEEASESQHVGLHIGELARLASAESQHEATESPIEAAFEAAEAAHNPGVSMLQVLP
jgi:hypothetical protein